MNERSGNILINNIVKVLMSNFWVIVLGFSGSFIFPKILSIDSYAQYQTFLLYSSYVVLLPLGFPSGMVINYAGLNYHDINNSQYKTEIYILFVILSIFTVICGGITMILHNRMWLYVTLAIFPICMVGSYRALYQAWNRFSSFTRLNVLIATAIPMLAIIYYLVTKNLTGDIYIYIYLSIYLIVTIYLIFEFKEKTRGVSANKVFTKYNWETEKAGFALFVGSYINILLLSADKQFVNVFFSVEIFAFYAFGMSMQSIMTSFITSISQPLFPAMAQKRFSRDDYKKLKEILLIFGSASGCSYFVVSIIVKHFITKYIEGLRVAEIFFIVFPALAVINILYINLYKIERKMKTYITTLAGVFGTAIILNLLAVHFIDDFTGVAVATTITYYVWFFVGTKQFDYFKLTVGDIAFLCVYIAGLLLITRSCNDFVGIIVYLIFDVVLAFICYGKNFKDYLKLYRQQS